MKHFDKKDANIYVYDKGKYVILAYKPLSDDEEVHYYTYEFKGKRLNIKKTLTQKVIIKNMIQITKKKICASLL